jgi:transposase InsO family protein
MIELPRSTYYYKPCSHESSLEEDVKLRDWIERIVLEFPGYGYRRVTHQLQRQGLQINHKRVLRLMRQAELLCRRRRRFVTTTDSQHGFHIYPNLSRGIKLTGLNQLWLADITYIRLRQEFVYLAALLDACSRKVVGWALGKTLSTSLTLEALKQAIATRHPSAGCIHHSDRGVQYACDQYVKILQQSGFQISMSLKGNPYDNAKMESFFKTLKQEEVYLNDYRNLREAGDRISVFLETVYNQKRLHSALGYLPPAEFEALTLSPGFVLNSCTPVSK